MRQTLRWIPTGTVLAAALAMFVHGPIAQFANYHAFADARAWLGIPNAGDVLSNVGFALVGLWGLWALRGRPHPYRLFLYAVVLTAFGSAFYHLAPDNARLMWDRLPIALACAGILAAVHAETHDGVQPRWILPALAAAAIASVLWWSLTDRLGMGDLRPYLLMQGAPLVLVPMWQAIHGVPRADRWAFGIAIALYIAAKALEVNDAVVLDAVHILSGHTFKHLLAVAAAAVIVANAVRRATSPPALPGGGRMKRVA